MRLNTLTENQRVLLIRALSMYLIYDLNKDEEEDSHYLLSQLHNGKGTP